MVIAGRDAKALQRLLGRFKDVHPDDLAPSLRDLRSRWLEIGAPGAVLTRRKPDPKKPCGLCGPCDASLFLKWMQQINAGLGVSIEDDSKRMELVWDIHADISRRYPLGIAMRLHQVLEALYMGAGPPEQTARDANYAGSETPDDDAVVDLEELYEDERKSMELNPEELTDLAKECSVAKSWLDSPPKPL